MYICICIRCFGITHKVGLLACRCHPILGHRESWLWIQIYGRVYNPMIQMSKHWCVITNLWFARPVAWLGHPNHWCGIILHRLGLSVCICDWGSNLMLFCAISEVQETKPISWFWLSNNFFRNANPWLGWPSCFHYVESKIACQHSVLSRTPNRCTHAIHLCMHVCILYEQVNPFLPPSLPLCVCGFMSQSPGTQPQ